jgi:hypothetical protein
MNLSTINLKLLLLSTLLFLTACAQNSMQIGHSVNLCCPGDYEKYRSYRLDLREMPGFLQEYVASEFDVAMQEKGLTRNDRVPDMTVRLTYRHINLNPEQELIDPFERSVNQDVTLRYVATILVDMFETSSDRHVWGGRINRIHTVLPGEYMHEERAKPAFLLAFRELLKSYPTI